jgi:hypothetical protein
LVPAALHLFRALADDSSIRLKPFESVEASVSFCKTPGLSKYDDLLSARGPQVGELGRRDVVVGVA